MWQLGLSSQMRGSKGHLQPGSEPDQRFWLSRGEGSAVLIYLPCVYLQEGSQCPSFVLYQRDFPSFITSYHQTYCFAQQFPILRGAVHQVPYRNKLQIGAEERRLGLCASTLHNLTLDPLQTVVRESSVLVVGEVGGVGLTWRSKQTWTLRS